MRDEQEVSAALNLHADTVRRICFLHLKNHADVEDIFQEVFLKYAQHKKSFESHEHEKAWLIRVAVNACRDLLRSPFRRKVSYLEDLVSEPSYLQEDHKEVLQAVIRLPEKYRFTVYMVYYEGYSVVELAALTGKRENTVYSWLTRARKLLKSELGGDDSGS